jgi:hypothetical protein
MVRGLLTQAITVVQVLVELLQARLVVVVVELLRQVLRLHRELVAQVAQVLMFHHLLVVRHCIKVVVVVEQVTLSVAQVVRVLAVLVVLLAHPLRLIRVRVAVDLTGTWAQAATAVQELFMSGGRFSYGAFCKNW